jgi:hypothetical protein
MSVGSRLYHGHWEDQEEWEGAKERRKRAGCRDTDACNGRRHKKSTVLSRGRGVE